MTSFNSVPGYLTFFFLNLADILSTNCMVAFGFQRQQRQNILRFSRVPFDTPATNLPFPIEDKPAKMIYFVALALLVQKINE
jgi:hypothetical protein